MKCLCGGILEQVAFNSDLSDSTELYDYVCNKCGYHCISEESDDYVEESKEDGN